MASARTEPEKAPEFDALVKSMFDDELGHAIDSREIETALQALRRSDLDRDLLRRECGSRYAEIRSAVHGEEDSLYLAWSAQSTATGPLSLVYRVSTTPYLQRAMATAGAIVALLAIGLHPRGSHGLMTSRNTALAAAGAAAASLLIPVAAEAAARLTRRSFLLRSASRLQAAVLGLAILVPASVIALPYPLGRAPGRHPPSLLGLELAWGLLAVCIALAFVRVSRLQATSYARPAYGISVRAIPVGLGYDLVSVAFAVTGPVGGLIVSASRQPGLASVTAASPPGWVLGTAAGLFLAGALLSAAGFNSQPARVLRSDYESAGAQFREALRGKGILPFLRETINARQLSRPGRLIVATAPGLDEQMDPLVMISTSARERVRLIMDRMSGGGSLGLAGPRGAGKTTLLRSYCGPDREDQQALAVLLSAPVEYSARDFLLHLYSTVCEEVARRTRADRRRGDPVPPGSRQAGMLLAYGTVLLAAGSFLILVRSGGLKISTSQLLGAVIALAGLGFLTQAVPRMRPGAFRFRGSGVLPGPAASLGEIAADRLEEIRFQQTISATWSGTLSLPGGLQGAFEGSQSLVRQAMLLPEIIDSLRSFLERAARDHPVYIGIDELDKLESDDLARQFLNEIKGVFGARRCYFMVSVSEDAVGSFERRGIPFRDVFDSTFDEIIRVPCLSFREARELLDRRVTQVPLPFRQFCFCLSGGLSRDLIRAARSMFEARAQVVSELGEPTLTAVAERVLARDLAGKVEAMSAAVARLDAEPQASDLLRWMRGVRLENLGAAGAEAEIGGVGAVDLTAGPDGRDTAVASLRRLAAEFAGYCYYLGTMLDLFAGPAGRDILTAADAGRSLDRLVVGRQLFTVSALVAWDEISAYRAACGLPAVPVPASLRGMPRGPAAANGQQVLRIPPPAAQPGAG